MSKISMVEAKLPPGFRFHPGDEELVCDYLMKKVSHCDPLLMIEVDLNKCEPWDIPDMACVGGKEWYFYSQRDRKYATGLRTNRATASGYWKATGKDRQVSRKGTLVGMRKTLVFYQGRAPKGRKTDWVMHEFRLEGPLVPSKISSLKEDWVLCRVFHKSREIVSKSKTSSYYDDTDAGSSLPALMDSYISFDQAPPGLDDPYEQVPCFSINVSENQASGTLINFQYDQDVPMSRISGYDPILVGGSVTSEPPILDPFSSCDKKVIKAVLDHFADKDVNPYLLGSPVGDQVSSESYLSEVGMSSIWNPLLMP